jgi:hypothetical protein
MRGYLSPRSSAAALKAGVASTVAENINPIKSQLIHEMRRLESVGANAQADSLGRVIARLEAWQARHG